MYTVLIADPFSIVRRGLRAVMDDNGLQCIIDEVETHIELQDLLRHKRYDMLILEPKISGANFEQALTLVHDFQEQTAILIFSAEEEELFSMKFFRSGAAGYIRKGAEPEAIFDAILTVLGGKRYLSTRMLDAIIEKQVFQHYSFASLNFTRREKEVLSLWLEHRTVAEMRILLGVSSSTIATHKSNILRKAKVSSREELIEKLK